MAKDYPLHVFTAWLGNTPRIAMKHYLQVTDDDFQRASKSGAQSGAHAAQQAHAPSRTEPHKTTQAPVLTGAYAIQRDAEYDAFSGVDLELVALIQAWAELPESVKTAVMEMVGG